MRANGAQHKVYWGDGPKGLSLNNGSRWAVLLLWVSLILAFVFVVAPLARRLPAVDTLLTYVEQTGIDASALYYTEVEEAGEAAMFFNNSNEYSPRGQDEEGGTQ